MTITRVPTTGKKTTLKVAETIFDVTVSPTLLAQAVLVYRANARQGTSKVQTRSEVSRTKKKWFRQKGTGNARHGSRNAPIFVGGGVAHGPKSIENWSKKLTKKQKSRALAGALTTQKEFTIVLDALAELEPKTSVAAKQIAAVTEATQSVLVVLSNLSQPAARGLRNLENVLIVSADQLNAYEVLSADAILLAPDTIALLENRITS